MSEHVQRMLASRRGFTVAAAGCGKTELLGRVVADDGSGRQLVLTHTHAGVAAVKKRLLKLGVPPAKYHIDTIAGWCLRYAAAYPSISGLALIDEGSDATGIWRDVYPCALRLLRTALGIRVLRASYEGVLVDEYQDCSDHQHEVVRAIAEVLPCRGVGDPMQSIFTFGANEVVEWPRVEEAFEILPPLTHPWRWERGDERGRELGQWLIEAREALERQGQVVVHRDAPVQVVLRQDGRSLMGPCWSIAGQAGSAAAIVAQPHRCAAVATGLRSQWPVVERFDDPDLFKLARAAAAGTGPVLAAAVVKFLSARMTGLGPALKKAVAALEAGKPTHRLSAHREHVDRLVAVADAPAPSTLLSFLVGALAEREWKLYRPESVYQLRSALQECSGDLGDLPRAAEEARTWARHRGRLNHARCVGTPYVLKGLEFEHAVVDFEPGTFTRQALYVALTRASHSLTIVTARRTLEAKC